MKTNKKFILPLILLAGGGLALYFIMKNKKKPEIEPAPPAPTNLPPPSINIPTDKIINAATKIINRIKKNRADNANK